MKSKTSFVVLVGFLGLILSGVAWAEVEVTLSHTSTPDGTITQVFSVANSEKIKVIVTDTDTGKFICEVTGIEIDMPGPKAAGTSCEKTIEHSTKFGGYYVRMKLKPGMTSDTLKEKEWILSTRLTGWRTDIQVGLAGSGLVSPEFFLDTGEDGVKRVRQDREAEDDVAFGFASFATVYRDNWRGTGLSLGLGLNENDLSVMIGPTVRLGNRAAITAGYSWGRVNRLPTGVSVGDAFEQDNLTLQKATRGDWFFSISIRGFTDAFQKKLAEANQKK